MAPPLPPPAPAGRERADGRIGPGASAWRTPPGFQTAEVRVRVRDTVPTARVLFAHSDAAPRETWAKDVEVCHVHDL